MWQDMYSFCVGAFGRVRVCVVVMETGFYSFTFLSRALSIFLYSFSRLYIGLTVLLASQLLLLLLLLLGFFFIPFLLPYFS